MKKYLVEIHEVHVSTRLVEAENEQEAIELAQESAEVSLDYTYTLDDVTAIEVQE